MNGLKRMDWRHWLAAPMARMLALSLSLHLALIMLIQPAPGSDRPRTLVVLNARLMEVPRVETQVETPSLAPETPPTADEPMTPAPVVPPETTVPARTESPPPLLTLPKDNQSPQPPPQVPAMASPAEMAPPAPAPLPSPVPLPTVDPHAASRSAEGPEASLPQVPVMHDTRWYTALEVDVHPKELPGRGPKFDYPETAREKGVEGTVKVLLRVDEFGQIQSLEILSGDPPGMFEESVRKGFSQAAFSPAHRNGVPVRALMQIRVRFELD
jgi:protein TonB